MSPFCLKRFAPANRRRKRGEEDGGLVEGEGGQRPHREKARDKEQVLREKGRSKTDVEANLIVLVPSDV